MMFSRLAGAVIAVCVFTVACVQVPNEELQAYTETAAEARMAGDLLLDEVAPLVEADGAAPAESCEVDAQLGFRTCFAPAIALGPEAARRDEAPEIRLRRLALAMIADYNQMLVDLAAGVPTERRRATFDSLSKSAAGIAALAPGGQGAAFAITGFGAPIGDVLERVGRIADSNLAARSVLEARPDLQKLIGVLINDSEILYGYYLEPFEGDIERLLPLRRKAQLTNDDAALAAVEAELSEIAEPMRAFETVLTAYVLMLQGQSESLEALATAIIAPTASPEVALATLVRQATEARAIGAGFLSEIRALRAASN